MAKKINKNQPSSTSETHSTIQFVFARQNYLWLLISISIVFIGFLLMSGNTDIYDFRKIVLAPIVVLLGFGLGFYAIFKRN